METKIEQSSMDESADIDLFEGLDTKDINLYADLYDTPPPENDKQAKELSVKIRKWISDGRPKPGDYSREDDKKMKDSGKQKKKRSLFGRFGK
jgi:fused signal recognition particle receptor